MGEDEIQGWADAVESLLARLDAPCVSRVVVVRETASTQDVARQMSGGRGGLLVLAGRQVGGRGRLGRQWADTSHLGVAATFVVNSAAQDGGLLSIAAGLAACRAIESALRDGGGDGQVGLRWPNDVVERGDRARKLAGVLIERSGDVAEVGIGINVLQRAGDWPDALGGRAVSLAELGCVTTRLAVVLALVEALSRVLGEDEAALTTAWKSRDVLIGTRRAFVHDGITYEGVVEDVSPRAGVRIRCADGKVCDLPALTTSMVH